ncbi:MULTISPECIES: hypothetical protein [unclassified Romboutsia]|uniref:hypothetical protein n=1 Tax=unclassified Romboutsia TaxID=2626894 RepID=UPI002ED1EC77
MKKLSISSENVSIKVDIKNKKYIKSAISGCIVGFICGFIGADGGMMMLIILTSILGSNLKQL